MLPLAGAHLLPLQHVPNSGGGGGIVPRGTRVDVFQEIYWVFLVLGTLVGIVVLGYTCYNAYKYRDTEERAANDDVDRPQLGEVPTGGGKGKKLFLSFAISAIIVISLIVWTYGALQYVETDSPAQQENALDVQVEGYQFGWTFTYPNGHETSELRVPEDRPVRLHVTSADVFHNFGIPALRVKEDAIPGQTGETWFIAEETGEYQAHCYELCGVGHSYMDATVTVMSENEYQEWYENTNSTEGNA